MLVNWTQFVKNCILFVLQNLCYKLRASMKTRTWHLCLSMSQLCQLYARRLADFGMENSIVSSTRQRDKIVRATPGLIPTFKEGNMSLSLKKTRGRPSKNHNSEVVDLAKSAQLIRRVLFDGTFPSGCQASQLYFC